MHSSVNRHGLFLLCVAIMKNSAINTIQVHAAVAGISGICSCLGMSLFTDFHQKF